jgi:two-component system, OmpR family, sensor histidine kinase MprB
MTIRRRLSIAAAVAVAVAVALASLGAYVAVRAKLRGEVDSSLRDRAHAVQSFAVRAQAVGIPVPPPGGRRLAPPGDEARFGGAAGYMQLLGPGGSTRPVAGDPGGLLPIDDSARRVAAGKRDTMLDDQHVDGHHLRVVTAPLPGGGAIRVARPLDEVDSVLHGLIFLLAAITIGGVALAAVLGGLVSRASLRPIRRFTDRTESVAAAPDLGQRLEVASEDELGRLARSFNATLEALERSAAAQRHLVADASHELRTPVASLKTNLEVLLSDRELPPAERRELLHDLVEQTDELTLLVGDIVDLARRGEAEAAFDDVPLDELVEGAVERARRHAPDIEYRTSLERCTVRGVPDRLDRAIYNLLDNAAKWSRPGSLVEVTLAAGELAVRDHGPGFKDDDLPLVFERFYRASDARTLPGSGLGLAIVKQVAETHGLAVRAENAPGGGACLRMRFPVLPGEPRAEDTLAAAIRAS